MQALIVGSGFSRHAGLPLQADFTKELLAGRDYAVGQPSRVLTEYLCQFVHDAFGHSKKAEAPFWPDLEDLFTCIDLAANTGHHLSSDYPPAELRTIRRALIVRIIRMLNGLYLRAVRKKDSSFLNLQRLVTSLDLHQTAFISLNWDIVIEALLDGRADEIYIRYGADERSAHVEDANSSSIILEKRAGAAVDVVKMHGSINWLYCDNCRRLYSFPASRVPRIADQLLSDNDWLQIKARTGLTRPKRRVAKLECRSCPEVTLSTRIATFSYLKALDFPMFHQSWKHAERILRRSNRWVFIGYSLPGADYEFKYLLKRIELSRKTPPEIVIVTGGGPDESKRTYDNYQRFFGKAVRKAHLYEDGITREVIELITGT